MNYRDQYNELLVKYLVKELSIEEEKFVVKWINAKEENKRHFEALRNTYAITSLKETVDKVNVNTEWFQFKKTIGGNHLKAIPSAGYQSEEEIKEDTGFVKSDRNLFLFKILIKISVAASVLVIIFLALVFKEKAVIKITTLDDTKTESTVPFIVRYEKNISNHSKKLMLKDGSQIVLAEKSEIRFQEPFTDNKREITLNGKATFKVATDQTKPFTVLSGDISTTALGTKFTVTAYKNEKKISVRLYEGRVLIKKLSGMFTQKEDFYLVPGQELSYEKKNNIATVVTFKAKNKLVHNDKNKEIDIEVITDSPLIPPPSNVSWYMFNNQSLQKVFEQLMEMHQVEIIYSKKDIHNMYFIGKFDKTDSVATILTQIAVLNSLKITDTNRKFYIHK